MTIQPYPAISCHLHLQQEILPACSSKCARLWPALRPRLLTWKCPVPARSMTLWRHWPGTLEAAWTGMNLVGFVGAPKKICREREWIRVCDRTWAGVLQTWHESGHEWLSNWEIPRHSYFGFSSSGIEHDRTMKVIWIDLINMWHMWLMHDQHTINRWCLDMFSTYLL